MHKIITPMTISSGMPNPKIAASVKEFMRFREA
jgi:hypothetical protein